MSVESPSPPPKDELPASAQRLLDRRERHRRDDQGIINTAVTMVGLGWLVVIPGLLGIYLGRWLDGRSGHGVTFSAGLGLLGVSLGCLLAWQRLSAHRPK